MKRIGFVLLLAFPVLLNAQIITTIAGTGAAGFSGDGGNAAMAQLNYPAGIALDRSGNTYIADRLNSRIRKISSSGIITTIAGNGINGYSGDGGAATDAQLCNNLWGIAVDNAGNVYVADENNQRIRKVNTAGIISTIAGTGTFGFSGDGGQATAAQLCGPAAVAADPSGNVYICDRFNQRIRKVDASGIITTLAGTGIAGFSGDGGLASAAMLNYPASVYSDLSGNLYIADSGNRIRQISTSGIITTIAGTGATGYGGDGGQATSALINHPSCIAADIEGNIYFGDSWNYRVRKINNMGVITTVAGNGRSGYSGDDSLATMAKINGPYGIAVDDAGILYIGDNLNNRIRKVGMAVSEVTNTATVEPIINVYPNPAQNALIITATVKITDVKITNLSGQVVVPPGLPKGEKMFLIDVSGLPPGLYFVTINGTEERKFVKQ